MNQENWIYLAEMDIAINLDIAFQIVWNDKSDDGSIQTVIWVKADTFVAIPITALADREALRNNLFDNPAACPIFSPSIIKLFPIG